MGSKSYSKGISWINDCRIPFLNDADKNYATTNPFTSEKNEKQSQDWGTKKIGNVSVEQGRFPANILVSDDMLNDGSVSSIKQNKDYIPPNEANSIHNYSRGKYSGIQDKGSNSRYYNIDKWFDNLIDV